jgi:hypothetical protein
MTAALCAPLCLFALASAILPGCATTTFDLSGVSVPVRADCVVPAGAIVVPFRVEAKSILWFHGLLGERVPDVAAIVKAQAADCDEVVNFRVRHVTKFPDWLATHLSLSLVRGKTVVVEGDRVTRP